MKHQMKPIENNPSIAECTGCGIAEYITWLNAHPEFYNRECPQTNKPCPFCGSEVIPTGDWLHPELKEPIKQVRHPEPDPDMDWPYENRCPLSGLVFPVFKWNRRVKVV
jgi:hypothetical protein